jgi:hypothetical protein
VKTIAEVIDEHRIGRRSGGQMLCVCRWTGTYIDHAAHVAQAIRESRLVHRVEELDALPVTAVIRSEDGLVAEKQHDGSWWEFDPPGRFPASAIVGQLAGYARVLWTPGDEQ